MGGSVRQRWAYVAAPSAIPPGAKTRYPKAPHRQPGQHAALDQQNQALDVGLVALPGRACLQVFVAEVCAWVTVNAGHAGPRHVLARRALADLRRAADLAMV